MSTPGFVPDALIAFSAGTLLKSSLVFSVALIGSRLTGYHAARTVVMWRFTFIAAVALPILTAALPPLEIPTIDLSHDGLTASAAKWIVVSWFLGALFGLMRLVADGRAARALARRARAVTDPRLIALVDRASHMTGYRGSLELRETDELADAAALGWLEPIVMLPVHARLWNDDELLGVLCHELEHLRNGDWLVLMLERVAVALFWVNPLVYFAFRSSALNREVLADDAVVRGAIPLDVYATRMITSARQLGANRRLAASLAFTGSTDTRIHALFEAQRQRLPVSRRSQLCVATIVIPFVLVLGATEPWRCIPGATGSTLTITCP